MQLKAVEHDVNSNNLACTDEANYVMSTSNKLSNRINSFYFSSCSIASLKNSFIVNKIFPCTTNVATHGAIYLNLVSYQPGQTLTANEQCQRALGSTAKLMFVDNFFLLLL